MEDLHYVVYVLAFFVPIAVAGAAGYLIGKYHERLKWRSRMNRMLERHSAETA